MNIIVFIICAVLYEEYSLPEKEKEKKTLLYVGTQYKFVLTKLYSIVKGYMQNKIS